MSQDNHDNVGFLIVVGGIIFLCICSVFSTAIDREKKEADSLEFQYNSERYMNGEPEVWRDDGKKFMFERKFEK